MRSPTRGRLVELADPRGGTVGQGTIVVGPAERPERLQWAVAHEIGESVAHRVFSALGVDPQAAPENAREQVANHLASCLLLPRDWFAADGSELDWDLFALKQTLRDGQPRADRPPYAGDVATDRRHVVRSRQSSLAPHEFRRPPAAIVTG